MSTIDYASVATAAKEKARDILRAQMIVRIQERVTEAKKNVATAIRHYSKVIVDAAEEATEIAEAKVKSDAHRDAMRQALGNVPGISADDIATASASLEDKYKEQDKEDAEEDKEAAKTLASMLEEAGKDIKDTQDELARALDNLDKAKTGELKVDKDALKSLSQKIIEETASAPDDVV